MRRSSFILGAVFGLAVTVGSGANAGTSDRGAGIAVGEYHPNAPRHRHPRHYKYHHRFHGWYGTPISIGYYGCYVVKRHVFHPKHGYVSRLTRVCS